MPHTAGTIQSLRTLTGAGTPLFLSEYGIGSAVDLWRATRHFERLGKTEVEDARFYRDKLDRYLADWKRWKLDELYARPEDFFAESLRKMAGQRTLGLNAIRSNPNIVGYSLTGMNDHVSCGEGLTTTFRELKPGTVDAMFEGFAPLRLCLFAEPVNVYRGARVRFEAVLANEDALAPGEYPVRLLVVGPQNQRIFEKTVNVTIAKEAPFAVPVFAEDVVVDGPSGRYRFLASFERGGAATGGETEFYVADPAEMPAVKAEVVLAGDDAELAKWLAEHGVRCRKLADGRTGAARGDSRFQDAARVRGTVETGPARGDGGVSVAGSLEEGRSAAGLAAAGEQGHGVADSRLALSEGRVGEAASDLRRPAQRRADGLHVLPRDHSRPGAVGPGPAGRGGGRRDQGFARLLVRPDAGRLRIRRGPLHPEHAADPREPRHRIPPPTDCC